MTTTTRVLIVDDDAHMCALLEAGLAQHAFHTESRHSAVAALEALAATAFDVVVTDLKMAGMNGLELTETIVKRFADVPVVVITGSGSIETAVAAMRVGAYDFLTKPIDVTTLHLTIERVAKYGALRRELSHIRGAVADAQRFGDLVGGSPAMRAIYDVVEKVADSNASVLITGETGTGKELIAREIHRRGRRSAGPFVALNCAAMPEALLEAELFGHAKGAFTDARAARAGLLTKASGGTLFLDEIAEMQAALQPKLLRALEERSVRPLGESNEVPFDVRIIAATNCDVETAVERGSFRADLFFRLNVIRIDLPPLRARGNDVLVIAERWVGHFAALAGKNVRGTSPPAAEKLLSYSWPGNVRELKNCIERAVTLTSSEQLLVEDLPERVREHRASHVLVVSDDPTELVSLEEMEKRYVLRVLQVVGGHRALAAKVLDLDRKTLYRKLLRYGVAEPRPQLK